MSSLSTKWCSLSGALGTSPKQLALLVASLVAALGIFGCKLLLAPKGAAAVSPVAAPAIKPVAAPAPVAIPETLFHTAPMWNLAVTPARSPFQSPADLQPAIDLRAPAESAATPTPSNLVLQATLDHLFAVVNGKTMRVGQSWTDPKSKCTFQLIEVGERFARFSSGGQVIEVVLNY